MIANEPEKRSLSNKTTLVSPLFQIALIIISSLILGITLYREINNWSSIVPVPALETINPTTYKKFGGFAFQVTIGLFIEDFNVFDTVKNDFSLSGILW